MNFNSSLRRFKKEWQDILQSDYGDVEVDQFMTKLNDYFHGDQFYLKCLSGVDADDGSSFTILTAQQVFDLIVAKSKSGMKDANYSDDQSLHYANLLSDWLNNSDDMNHREWYLVYRNRFGWINLFEPMLAKDISALLYRLSQG